MVERIYETGSYKPVMILDDNGRQITGEVCDNCDQVVSSVHAGENGEDICWDCLLQQQLLDDATLYEAERSIRESARRIARGKQSKQ